MPIIVGAQHRKSATSSPPISAGTYGFDRMTGHTVILLAPGQARQRLAALADLLIDAVEGGASVNFVWPMTQAKAMAWWEAALASHARGEQLIFTAEADGQVDGTVQLILAPQENQAFRADLAKMLVRGRARRQGPAQRCSVRPRTRRTESGAPC